MTANQREFNIENANAFLGRTITQGNVDKSVQQDWRAAISANFDLTSDQAAFLRDLPLRSVVVVQSIIGAIGKEGGSLSIIPTESAAIANLVASGIPSLKLSPQWTICSFGIHITKCEWFPR